MKRLLSLLTSTLLAAASLPALAQIEVRDAWVRATVPAQTATGAFLQLRSTQTARLVQAKSPVANTVEIHEMQMVGSVMKMRAVAAVELPAGQTVELKPGGYHIMLMDLKQPLKRGETVPLTLLIETKDGKRESVEVRAMVRPLDAEAEAHHHHH